MTVETPAESHSGEAKQNVLEGPYSFSNPSSGNSLRLSLSGVHQIQSQSINM